MEQPPNPSEHPDPFAPKPSKVPPPPPSATSPVSPYAPQPAQQSPAPPYAQPAQPYPQPTNAQPQQPVNPYAQPQVEETMAANPYAAPQARGQATSHSREGIPLTPVGLYAVLGTQIWVKIVSVILIVLSGLQLLNLIRTIRNAPMYYDPNPITLYILPLGVIAMYVIMSVRLFQYGNAIGRLRASGNPQDFANAMSIQTKYWRLLGIFCIIMIALFFIGMIMGIAGASRGYRY